MKSILFLFFQKLIKRVPWISILKKWFCKPPKIINVAICKIKIITISHHFPITDYWYLWIDLIVIFSEWKQEPGTLFNDYLRRTDPTNNCFPENKQQHLHTNTLTHQKRGKKQLVEPVSSGTKRCWRWNAKLDLSIIS